MQMSFSVDVENVRCGGCASIIRKAFNDQVEVDIESGHLVFDLDESERQQVAETLKSLGYPEIGSAG
jgi:copper chaperone